MKSDGGTARGINPHNRVALSTGNGVSFHLRENFRERQDKKNAGLKAVTLIATLNPVSQVLW